MPLHRALATLLRKVRCRSNILGLKRPEGRAPGAKQILVESAASASKRLALSRRTRPFDSDTSPPESGDKSPHSETRPGSVSIIEVHRSVLQGRISIAKAGRPRLN